MNSDIKRLIKKYNLELAFLPILGKGYLVPRKNKPDLVCVRQDLSEADIKKVILHEIGHYKKDRDVIGSYKVNYTSRVKAECEANNYMIEALVKEYARLGYEISAVNYCDLAESIGTGNYLKVRDELAKYTVKK